MCNARVLNPMSVLPGGKNPLINPTALITNSSNRLVNPLASFTADDKKTPATPAASGSSSLLTASADPAQKKPSSLLGA